VRSRWSASGSGTERGRHSRRAIRQRYELCFGSIVCIRILGLICMLICTWMYPVLS
jgi:hypothetical protein